MNKPKGGLGRGLGALLPQQGVSSSPKPFIAPAPVPIPVPVAAANVNVVEEPVIDVAPADFKILEISPSQIAENPHQPRYHFAPDELEDLKASIKEHGILQPLVVTSLGGGKYELIAGERRLRSARAIGMDKVPVIVRKADEQQKLELALIENIQRAELNAVEEAKAYKSLIENFGLTQEDAARRVGKSRSQVANTMRLLELDDEILLALVEGKISKSHARTLLAEPNLSVRMSLFRQMMNGGMTVRAAEARAGNIVRRSRPGKDANIAAIEAELREKLGTKVTIDMVGGTGKVSIHFYSKDDLKSLIERLS